MIRYAATLMFAVSAVALGASENMSRINGSLRVEAGRQAGDVSTVNGSITLETGTSAREVETVNGSVRLESHAAARSLETVNGGVVLEEGAQVSEGVRAVNGRLTLRQGARVGGRLENVNGEFRLEGAAVGAGIETVNGDVFVGAGSRVDGGIHVRESRGWGRRKASSNPEITVESGAVVNGPLRFEREVDLYVGDGAVIGPIEGIAPRRQGIP